MRIPPPPEPGLHIVHNPDTGTLYEAFIICANGEEVTVIPPVHEWQGRFTSGPVIGAQQFPWPAPNAR
jgi:hypothetical protein